MLVQLFLQQTPVQPETFFYHEKEHFSYIRTHTFFVGSDFGISVAQKQGTSEDQDLIIIRGKKISALINDWESNFEYGKNLKAFAAKVIRFLQYIKQLANGTRATATRTFCNLNFLLSLQTFFPALKLTTQNIYLHYNMNINHKFNPSL